MPGLINIIGGSAYFSTGGIQAMNRLLVRELGSAGLLRRAYFLWDDTAAASEEALPTELEPSVRLYGLRRRPFIQDLVRNGVYHPGDRWLCTHVNYAALGLLVGGWRKNRVAVMLHAAELDEEMSALKKFALRRFGFVIAVSEFTKMKAVKLGVKPARVRVLANGVDDPCPNWQPNANGSETQNVLFVGRMDERYKGQLELLDAMALLQKRLPRLRLTFVGGGRILDEWRDEANRRNLSDRVEFTGRISEEELRQRYMSAAIFAMPSENEGFGLVYAEAMAQGIPCIGSDRDAAREVIVHGETGLCVPAGNSTALADAIRRLIVSPALRAKMGRQGRQRFVENFTVERYRDRLLQTVGNWLGNC